MTRNEDCFAQEQLSFTAVSSNTLPITLCHSLKLVPCQDSSISSLCLIFPGCCLVSPESEVLARGGILKSCH